MKALIIGAGIHGITLACELAKHSIKVTVVDRRQEILLETSNSTHNRVNMGYHYPRSFDTAKECHEGFEFFKRNLPSALYYPSECYYSIESNSSNVDAKQYKSFLDEVGLKYTIEDPINGLLLKENIEASFKVWEPCYDVQILRRIFNQKIENLGVELVLGFDIVDARIDGRKVKLVSFCNHTLEEDYDIIVNATYAFTNNIQRLFRCEEPKKQYRFQKTEVVVATHTKQTLPAITIMDGAFITVLPYAYGGHSNEYLVYDVVNSVHTVHVGEYLPVADISRCEMTNYSKMLESGKRYFSFMEDLKPKSSLWAYRPIPLSSLSDDSRVTNVIKHNNHNCFYSILEGKFVSAPLKGNLICEMILEKSL